MYVYRLVGRSEIDRFTQREERIGAEHPHISGIAQDALDV